MATTGDTIYEWDKNPRMPVPAPPAGSCDCQFHIYGDPAQFPPRTNAPYPPIESATFSASATHAQGHRLRSRRHRP